MVSIESKGHIAVLASANRLVVAVISLSDPLKVLKPDTRCPHGDAACRRKRRMWFERFTTTAST